MKVSYEELIFVGNEGIKKHVKLFFDLTFDNFQIKTKMKRYLKHKMHKLIRNRNICIELKF